ncbi:MAG: hypothetical protein D6733_07110 [Methanobacteriota archaeon]|nr:MAG: hypothetical protein D6733_07110 [Euryarchaeota archaeon]
MSEAELDKLYEEVEFLKKQVIEIKEELEEIAGRQELDPAYEEKLKLLLSEEGTRYSSISEFKAAF